MFARALAGDTEDVTTADTDDSSSLFPDWLMDFGSFNQVSNEDMGMVLYTLAITIFSAGIFWFWFSYARMTDESYFSPRTVYDPEHAPRALSNKNMYSWMRELWNITDETILDSAGYDILTFIRFYRFNTRVFATFALYAFFVLLPVNGSQESLSVDSFQRWSMTNIAQGSALCWYHLVGIFLLTAVVIYYLEEEFVFYAQSRHRYLRDKHAHLRTVLVEGIPHKMRSNATLALYFEVLYPGQVDKVHLAQDIRLLETTVNDRNAAMRQLETYLYTYRNAQLAEKAGGEAARRPVIERGGVTVDAIRYYVNVVQQLNDAVARDQAAARDLAQQVDTRLTRRESLSAISRLLRVTEIGALDTLLRNRGGADARRGGGDSRGSPAATRPTTPPLAPVSDAPTTYGTSDVEHNSHDDIAVALSPGSSSRMGEDMQNYAAFRQEVEADDDDMSVSVSGVSAVLSYVDNLSHASSGSSHRHYSSLSFTEWVSAVCTADWSEKWANLVGRNYRNGGTEEDPAEAHSLIRPLEERSKFLPKAFVTFKSYTAATVAKQVIHMQLADHMEISEADEPRDLRWNNLYTSRTVKSMRFFFSQIVVLFLIAFWVVPVSLVTYVTALTNLQQIGWISTVTDAVPLVNSAFSLLQPAAILGIMQLLPPIFHLLGEWQGIISWSQNQRLVYERYFLFQVVNVFLVATIAGSVADTLYNTLTSPATIFELLGMSLPKMGGYFTTYILLKGSFGLGSEMVRIVGRLQQFLKRLLFTNLTLRERTEANLPDPRYGALRFMDNPGTLRHSKLYAQDMLVTVLCATFANIAPLLLVAGVSYFFFAGQVYKYQWLYVFKQEYETGGRWWPPIARSIVVALLFGQCTMVGMLILKTTYTEIYFLAPLIACTVYYLMRMVKQYEPLGSHLPLDMATSIDLDKRHKEDITRGEGADSEDFVQPPMRLDNAYLLPKLDFDVSESDTVKVPVQA